MTPEAQRLAIAKVHRPELVKAREEANRMLKAITNGVYPIVELESYPQYLNDLNAMHAAEQTLNSAQRHRFNVIVACLHSGIPLAKIPIDYDFKRIGFKAALAAIDATASERAEAFLRAIGKWTDS